MGYYKKHLEEYNLDFKYQVEEFREGNMLFEIMERNVWSKAGADSVGLANYYSAHKENYKWAAGADAVIYNAPDEKKAAEVMAADKAGKAWEAIVESSNNTVQADSGRFELSQLPGAADNPDPKENSYSPIIKNSDGTVAFVKYIRMYPPGQQRTFAEARGLVINDYQNVLEQQWVVALRKKYPVTINEAVFREMLK
jgi:peptidyl-prolyl cis-trans isomerase SurA